MNKYSTLIGEIGNFNISSKGAYSLKICLGKTNAKVKLSFDEFEKFKDLIVVGNVVKICFQIDKESPKLNSKVFKFEKV